MIDAKNKDQGTIPTAFVDEGYTSRLADAVAYRLGMGEPLQEALGETLRHQAPVDLREPYVETSDGSGGGLLVGLGVAAALGAGFYLAYTRLLDENQRTRLQTRFNRLKRKVGLGQQGSKPGERYATVHGTEGARMPAPDRDGHARRAEMPNPISELGGPATNDSF